MVIGGLAAAARRLTSGRSSPTPLCCSRSARSCPRSTCPAARSSTRPSPWPRTATSSRSRASSPSVAWIARRRPAWDATRPRRDLRRRRRSAFGGRCAAVVGVARGPRGLGPAARRGSQAVATALDGAGAARPTGSCRSTRPATGTGPATAGVVLVNDPLDTIEQVARAYDIRWLVLERDDSVAAARADPGRRPAAGLGRAAPVLEPTTRRTRSGSSRSYPLPTALRDARAAREACPDPALAGASRSRSSSASSSAVADRLPEARGHGLLRRRRAQPASRAAASSPTRCGATARRRWCSRGPRSRSGCRCRRSSPPSRWRCRRRPIASAGARQVVVGRSSARSSRCSPGAWPPTSPRSAACRTAGRARWPSAPASPRRSTCRCSSTRRCPTRRCCSRALVLGACLLMTRIAARPARRAAAGPAAHRHSALLHRPRRATRNEASGSALRGPLAGLAGGRDRRARGPALIGVVARRRACSSSPRGRCRDWVGVRQPAARPGR